MKRRFTMKIIMEIRAGEGGRDAEMLVGRQANLYMAQASAKNLRSQILEKS